MRFYLLLTLLFVPFAHADNVDRLKAFFQNSATARAHFHQTVVDKQGRKIQEVDGMMQLQRPGKFRWDYNKPYVQIIVGDGQKVWLFDPDLNQVTVRNMDKALGASPAALLSGSKEMENAFVLKDEGVNESVDWISATPKDQDSGFEKVMLGLKNDNLVEMELHDHFGQITVIEFNHLEKNVKLASQSFIFNPPKGADILGDK